MLTDYASVGGVELWNTTRLNAYLHSLGSPFVTGPDICHCETLTPAMVGDDLPFYDTPAADPAPWYDPDHDITGEFLGFLPLSIAGLDDDPRSRNVTNAVGGGGVFGPVRALPRTMTVTGILIGTTCCAAEFGIHYLAESLAGCDGDSCDGGCFEMYDCCPTEDETPEQFEARARRTFRRTSIVDGPRVIRRDGSGTCGRGTCSGGDVITVEFTLVAASPWAWTETIPLLDVPLPIPDDTECVEWCVGDACLGEGCLFAACVTFGDACADPRNPVPTPPQPTVPSTSFCVPLAPTRVCYDIDLTNRPQWSSDVPMITVNAGSTELRNVKVAIYEKKTDTPLDCDEIADQSRCSPQNEFVITYVPAGGSVTIDGQTGRATALCAGLCQSASSVYGDQNGGPVRINELSCAQFCFCVETDSLNPPADDATVELGVSGRGY